MLLKVEIVRSQAKFGRRLIVAGRRIIMKTVICAFVSVPFKFHLLFSSAILYSSRIALTRSSFSA